MLRAMSCLVLILGLVLSPARADEAEKISPDVVYGHKDGLALTFDVFRPDGRANGAGVLFMVSGGWYSRWSPPEQARQRFKPLLDKGFTVFAVRHGSSPRYKIPEIIQDVRRSVRFVRQHAKEYGVDPQRLGVFGGSAGGHLSLVLGTTADDGQPNAKDPLLRVSDRVEAVVAYFPPTDLRPWVKESSPYYKNYPALQFDPGKADACSPLLNVSPDDAPTLLIHGDKDKLVPLDHSENILKKLEQTHVPSELLVIPGAAHGFRGADNQRAEEAMVGWFEKYLAKPAASKKE